MSKNQVHILNGDALLQQMGNSVEGEKIVVREALIDGNIDGNNLSEFYTNRAKFFVDCYNLSAEQEYFEKSVSEFTKIQEIPTDTEINLWFEDDLFCQTNFWFVNHLILEFELKNSIFLVRPSKGNEYSFGNMKETEFITSFNNKIQITSDNQIKLQKLWLAYQQNNTSEMISIAQSLHPVFPFVGPAIYANITKKLKIHEKSLKHIITDLDTTEFEPVFREFCKRETIYGFGDSQVKRMFDKIMQEKK